MKKIAFKMVVAMVVAVGVVLGVSNTQKSQQTSDLLKENVEALASDETTDKIICVGVGCVDCPFSSDKVELYFTTYNLQ